MAYSRNQAFEWNAAKSESCLIERGFDFAYATAAFLDPDRLVHLDSRHDYGEPRYQLIGKVEGRHFVIVYTPRNAAIRIISARKANAREITQYENRA